MQAGEGSEEWRPLTMTHAPEKPRPYLYSGHPIKNQIWREVDPRYERHVRVLSVSADKEIIVIETVIRSSNGWVHKPKSPKWTYAGVERFNGKIGGYELIAKGIAALRAREAAQ